MVGTPALASRLAGVWEVKIREYLKLHKIGSSIYLFAQLEMVKECFTQTNLTNLRMTIIGLEHRGYFPSWWMGNEHLTYVLGIPTEC